MTDSPILRTVGLYTEDTTWTSRLYTGLQINGLKTSFCKAEENQSLVSVFYTTRMRTLYLEQQINQLWLSQWKSGHVVPTLYWTSNMTRTHCAVYRRMEPVEVVIVYTPVNSHMDDTSLQRLFICIFSWDGRSMRLIEVFKSWKLHECHYSFIKYPLSTKSVSTVFTNVNFVVWWSGFESHIHGFF